jgi:lysophospholipase L1-like esterase
MTDEHAPLVRCAVLATLMAVSFTAGCRSSKADGAAFVNPSHDVRQFGGQGKPLIYVVMGDSTAAGQGADYEHGIAVQTSRAISGSHAVALTNVSISGARVHDVVSEQLEEAARLRPDLVLLSVAANDVTHLTSIGSMRADFVAIVARLRLANPKVAIVVTGAPEMGAPPRVPWLLRPVASWRMRAVNTMVMSLAREQRLEFAPIAAETGPAFRRDPTLFAADRFHPNERGYALWIRVLTPALQRALQR